MASIIKEPDAYWSERYQHNDSPWDVGYASPTLTTYCSQLPRSNRILIPGCGNAHEADWLVSEGFSNITLLDVSEILVTRLARRFHKNAAVKVLHEDFFTHPGEYDLFLEQTFFCALPPSMREAYAVKAAQLLAFGGKLAGVFFDKHFEDGPPFGGSRAEYEALFSKHFIIEKMEPCYNSIPPRRNAELFVILRKP